MQLRKTKLSITALAVLAATTMPALAQVAAFAPPASEAASTESFAALDARAAEYYAARRYAEAEPLYRRVLSLRESSLGPDHADVAATLNNLALLLKYTQRRAEAESLYRRALFIYEQTRGPEHPAVADVLGNLAALLDTITRYKEAEPLYRRTLAIREKTLEPDHPLVARALSSLGVLLDATNRSAEAEPMLRRALEIQEKQLGSEHLDLAPYLGNLAKSLIAMRRLTEAEPLLRRALAIREHSPVVEYGNVARNMIELAELLEATIPARLAEAEQLYRRSIASLEQMRSPARAELATALNGLAQILAASNRRDEAERLHRQALTIREDTFGADSPYVASSLSNLAGLLETASRFDEAERLYRRALLIGEQAFGSKNAFVAVILSNLSEVLRSTGGYEEAEALQRRALAIREETQGRNHPDVANSLHNLAGQLKDRGRLAESEATYQRALEIREKFYGPEHPLVANVLDNIGLLLQKRSRYAQAEALHRRALAIRENAFDSRHTDLARSLNNLALLFKTTGRYDEAEPLYSKALTITEDAMGPEDPSVAISLNNLALLLEKRGQYTAAEPLLVRSLAIREKIFGSEHVDVAAALNNLAGLLRITARPYAAEPLYHRALAIFEKNFGLYHPGVATTLNNLSNLLQEGDRDLEAEPMLLRSLAIADYAGEPEVLWTVQGNLMAYYSKNKSASRISPQPDLAIYFGKLAINTLQGVRGALVESEQSTRQSFLAIVELTYKRLAALLIDEGRLSEAQQVLAMLKEEEYHDFIRRDGTADSRTTRADLLTNEQQWQQRYQQVAGQAIKLAEEQRMLKKKRDMPPGLNAADARRVDALEEELKAVDRVFAEAIAEIKTQITALRGGARDAQVARKIELDLGGMVGELGQGVVLLHTLMLADHLRLLVTHAETRKAYKINVGEPELNRRINALLVAVKDPGIDPRLASAALYDALIRPIEADLAQAKARVLMVSLDGALRYVPLAALFDGKRYLAEKLALSIYTDASRDKIKDTPRANWRIAALGVSKPHRGFTALPGVPRELAAIVRDAAHPAGALAGQSLLDGAFTAEAFSKLLAADPAVVHVASHFKFTPGNETDSYLLLGNGTTLTLEDFRNNRYSLKRVDLLTLSACQTAVGDNNRAAKGSEVESFAVMAQNKGAKSVVASLWSVADDSTAQFMQRFYRLRGQGKLSKAEAMRQTQLAMIRGQIKPGGATAPRAARQIEAPIAGGVTAPAYRLDPNAQYAHPFYWAPFILMGNWL